MVDPVGIVKDLGYEEGLAKVTLPVHGMSCASCVKRAEGALNGLDGVVKAGVNFATGRATIQYIPGAVLQSPLLMRGRASPKDLCLANES